MSAPRYVPVTPDEKPRVYRSAPWTEAGWVTDRPATVKGPWPRGPRLGDPAPDAGFAMKLLHVFDGKLVLKSGEDEHDVRAGITQVALKRSSLFGRGPTVTDVRIALTIWGYLVEPDPALIAFRKPIFEAVGIPNHYVMRRQVADAVPAAVLRKTQQEITRIAASDWRALFRP